MGGRSKEKTEGEEVGRDGENETVRGHGGATRGGQIDGGMEGSQGDERVTTQVSK